MLKDSLVSAAGYVTAITFDPGEDGWPPVNECIHIDKAIAATKILALTVLDILGHEPRR